MKIYQFRNLYNYPDSNGFCNKPGSMLFSIKIFLHFTLFSIDVNKLIFPPSDVFLKDYYVVSMAEI